MPSYPQRRARAGPYRCRAPAAQCTLPEGSMVGTSPGVLRTGSGGRLASCLASRSSVVPYVPLAFTGWLWWWLRQYLPHVNAPLRQYLRYVEGLRLSNMLPGRLQVMMITLQYDVRPAFRMHE